MIHALPAHYDAVIKINCFRQSVFYSLDLAPRVADAVHVFQFTKQSLISVVLNSRSF